MWATRAARDATGGHTPVRIGVITRQDWRRRFDSGHLLYHFTDVSKMVTKPDMNPDIVSAWRKDGK